MNTIKKSQRGLPAGQAGIVEVYIALIITILITTGAIVLSGILSRQIRFASDVVANEQAFYTADTGAEATLSDLKTKISGPDFTASTINGTVNYDDNLSGAYAAKGQLQLSADKTRIFDCVQSQGSVKTESRRIAIGPAECSQ
jgi:hypothetical protein